MRKYSYTHILEYLPVRYSASREQRADRETVFEFKDGYCSPDLKQELVKRVNMIREKFSGSSWRICFIPASSHDKTMRRYSALASYLQRETGCPCDIDAIQTIHDTEPGHLTGKTSNPAANFTVNRQEINNQNIILVDDVITRGRTFADTANKLVDNGARQVVGLFVAKTINPDWN